MATLAEYVIAAVLRYFRDAGDEGESHTASFWHLLQPLYASSILDVICRTVETVGHLPADCNVNARVWPSGCGVLLSASFFWVRPRPFRGISRVKHPLVSSSQGRADHKS